MLETLKLMLLMCVI